MPDRPDAGERLGDSLVRRSWVAAPAVLALLAFSPAILGRFGFLDDYWLLFYSSYNPAAVATKIVGQGRPVAAPVFCLLFRLAGSIDGLGAVRAISALGVALTVSSFAVIAARLGYRRPVAFLLGVSMILLPSVATVGSWASCWNCSWAMLLSVWSGWQLQATDGSPVRKIFISAAIIAAADLVYQPGAMAFWLVWLLAVLSPAWRERSWRQLIRTTAEFVAAMAGSSLVALAAQRAGAGWAHVAGVRAALTTDFAGKAGFLWRDVWPFVAEPWASHPSLWAGGAVLVAVALMPRVDAGRRVMYAAAVMAVLTLADAPAIASAENWATWRSMLGIQPILPICLAAVAEGVLDRLRVPAQSAALAAVAAALAFAAVWWTAHFNQSVIVEPQERELVLVRPAVLEATQSESLALLPSLRRQRLGPAVHADDYGFPATSVPWDLIPLVELIYREEHGTLYGRAHDHARDSKEPLAETHVLDFKELLDQAVKRP